MELRFEVSCIATVGISQWVCASELLVTPLTAESVSSVPVSPALLAQLTG